MNSSVKHIPIKMLLSAVFLMLAFSTSAQLKIKPVIMDIGASYDKPTFVLVLKATEKNPNERVIMSDFTVDTEAFDPMKINSYPVWEFSNFSLYSNDGTKTRYVSMRCVDTNKYMKYTSGYGPKMLDAKEYDEIMKRDEQGKQVHSTEEMLDFYKRPIVHEAGYIRLGIYNKKNDNLVVTPGAWHTRDFKLVYVK